MSGAAVGTSPVGVDQRARQPMTSCRAAAVVSGRHGSEGHVASHSAGHEAARPAAASTSSASSAAITVCGAGLLDRVRVRTRRSRAMGIAHRVALAQPAGDRDAAAPGRAGGWLPSRPSFKLEDEGSQQSFCSAESTS